MRLDEFKNLEEASEGFGKIKKSPEELRKAKQASAAQVAQSQMKDNPAPTKPGDAAFSNMASSLTPKQQSSGEQAFSGMAKSLSGENTPSQNNGGQQAPAQKSGNSSNNNNRLTREWIQFLKNNQIVSSQADESGKLKYNRQPNVGELYHFLELMGVKKGLIANAISQVVKQIPPEQPTAQAPAKSPTQASSFSNQTGAPQAGVVPTTGTTMPANVGSTPARPDTSGYSNVSKQMNKMATKAPGVRQQGGGKQPGKLSDDPRAVARRQATAAKKKNVPVTEAFKDTQGMGLSEKQVEAIFKLVMQAKKQGTATQPGATSTQGSPDDKKILAVNKVKRFIRDELDPGEVKALWRALTNG